MKELIPIVKEIVRTFNCNLEVASVMAFLETETGGKGFNGDGKIIIQFEPSWYKKLAPYSPSGLWSLNKVDVQSKEWTAFNDAFSKNPTGAMQATSIGMGQIMGFQWKALGYNSVNDMWDDAKRSIDRQIWQVCKLITSNKKLLSALHNHDWNTVACIYNGSKYKELAIKLNRVPYDKTMALAYTKYASLT